MNRDERARLGAWYTPHHLVDEIVGRVFTGDLATRSDRPLRVLDPACGDGRFLAAVAAAGVDAELTGVDVDPDAVRVAREVVRDARFVVADALSTDWGSDTFDVVVGNPPFLSPLASRNAQDATSRRLDVGPYADAAVEFLSLAADLVEPDGGRVAFVLPQSILASRDARSVRARFDRSARVVWSWVGDAPVFDAQVHTCAIVFEFGSSGRRTRPSSDAGGSWSAIVNRARRIPPITERDTAGTIGDRCRLSSNFRDEYYGMLPAVTEAIGSPAPRLVTSGLIDPGTSRWGERAVRIGGQIVRRPVVELDQLDERMRRWAASRLVPKVLIANQTRIIEAVADRDGAWLPGVPVISAVPGDGADPRTVDEIAAVLTSPTATLWVWHLMGGTGRSPTAVRLTPSVVAGTPWPAGPLDLAVAALRSGDVRSCANAVEAAFGASPAGDAMQWWLTALERIERRQPARTP